MTSALALVAVRRGGTTRLHRQPAPTHAAHGPVGPRSQRSPRPRLPRPATCRARRRPDACRGTAYHRAVRPDYASSSFSPAAPGVSAPRRAAVRDTRRPIVRRADEALRASRLRPTYRSRNAFARSREPVQYMLAIERHLARLRYPSARASAVPLRLPVSRQRALPSVSRARWRCCCLGRRSGARGRRFSPRLWINDARVGRDFTGTRVRLLPRSAGWRVIRRRRSPALETAVSPAPARRSVTIGR